MRWDDYKTDAANLIDSTCDELGHLGLWEVLHGLIDHTIDVETARAALEGRRRVSALITGPRVYNVETRWGEHTWVNLEWVNVTHGTAQGVIRSTSNAFEGEPNKFYALLCAGGEDIEFDTVEQIDNAIAALNDLRDAARELPFTRQANADEAAA